MKKILLTIAIALMVSVLSITSVFASSIDTESGIMLLSSDSSEEKSDEKSDDDHDDDHGDEDHDDEDHDDDHGDESSTVTATAEDFNITTNDDNTVTFLYADGTAMANVSVTVKNTQTGEDGDISRDEYSTDENGVFDYSPFLDDDVAILRLTDPSSSNTLEYTIDSGVLSIEAGKSSGDDGDKSGGDMASTSETNTYMIIGGIAAIVVIGIVAVIIVIKQKKKKAAFAAKAKKKTVKKK